MAVPDAMLLLALPPLLIAAGQDVATRTIPHFSVLAVAMLGAAARLGDGSLAAGLAAALAVLALGWLAWRAGCHGAGDVKLLAAAALLVPPTLVPVLLLAVALAGGVLALGYLMLSRALRLAGRPAWVPRPASLGARLWRAEAWRIRRGGALPYGVAIVAGALIVGWPPG